MSKLNVIILTFNTKKITKTCLKSIFDGKNKLDFKVWVLDNASTDGTVEELKPLFPKAEFLRSEKNLGFVGGNNLLLEKVFKNSEYTLLLNSDTILSSGSLDTLYDFATVEGVDIASCELKNKDGSFQPNAGDLPTPIPLFFWLSQLDGIFGSFFKNVVSYHRTKKSYYKEGRRTGWVSGSVMMIKKEVFEKNGFLDKHIFAYCEDVDFCWRAFRSGFKTAWTKKTNIVHIGGASTEKPKISQWIGEFKGLTYLYKKYYGLIASYTLKLLIYFFTILRIIAFFVAGKPNYSKAYAKIFIAL